MKHPRVYGSLLSVFILIVLASCATLPRSDVYVPSAKEDNRGRIEDIERKLVLQYRKADSSESAAVKKNSIRSSPCRHPTQVIWRGSTPSMPIGIF